MRALILSATLGLSAALVSAGCSLPGECDETYGLSGTVDGINLSTLNLDFQGRWIEGSALELLNLELEFVLGILSLVGGEDGDDALRINYLKQADLILEGFEEYPGAHLQIAFYGVVDSGLRVGDSINVVDASSLDGPHGDDGVWQENFRELVDTMQASGEPMALVSIALDREGQSAALPTIYFDGAFHASEGQVTITEAWSGLREIDNLQSKSGGLFGRLSPVYFDASLTIDGSPVSLGVDCAEYEDDDEDPMGFDETGTDESGD